MWNPTYYTATKVRIDRVSSWIAVRRRGVVYDDVDTVTATDGLGSTNVRNYVGRRQFNLARGRPRNGVVGLKDT